MVNSKTPGLLTKWRAPFDKGIKGSTRRHGKMTLAIINPTEKKFRLPKMVKITNYRPAGFIKKLGSKDLEALLVLGPESLNTIPALKKDQSNRYGKGGNKEGRIHVCKLCKG